MSWRVFYQEAYEAWTEPDPDIRLEVLNWFFVLFDGPPKDAHQQLVPELYTCVVPATGNFVDFLALPYNRPTIIVKEIR